jgi:hypothetical protein
LKGREPWAPANREIPKAWQHPRGAVRKMVSRIGWMRLKPGLAVSAAANLPCQDRRFRVPAAWIDRGTSLVRDRGARRFYIPAGFPRIPRVMANRFRASFPEPFLRLAWVLPGGLSRIVAFA